MDTPEKICFVIAPIGEEGSETRKRSDLVFNYLLKPAAENQGFTPVRADQIPAPGVITSQIIQHILDDALVIADLTARNPNVFYELAIRHAVNRPVIQIMAKNEPLPFDVAGIRTILFDIRDLDSVEKAKWEIVRQIQWIEVHPAQFTTPVSMVMGLKEAKTELRTEHEAPEPKTVLRPAESMNSISNIYNIQHFHGVIGHVNSGAVQIGNFSSIHEQLKHRGLSQAERNDLENIVDELKTAEKQPEKKQKLLTAGVNWVVRNADKLGTLSETIRKWFEPEP